MGFRFRRSVKLAPGLRMNFGATGASMTFGGRGGSVTVGKRGAYANVGIPGTGFSFRQRINSGSSSSNRTTSSPVTTTQVSVTVSVRDDGTVFFKDRDGNTIDDALAAKIKKQNSGILKDLIQQKCDEINSQVEDLAKIHHYTPPPTKMPVFHPDTFGEPKPSAPQPETLGFFASLFKSKREKIESENQARAKRYEEELVGWHQRKDAFEQELAAQRKFIEQDIYHSVPAMEAFLDSCLQGITWPRETILSTEILDGGSTVFIDVDLPEIEDMPRQTANVPQRGMKLMIKDMSQSHVQRLYMEHTHGVGFRIIGEVFSNLPNSKEVVLSAFTQRSDKATGKVQDDYLYSVRVSRDAWGQINFKKLPSIDVVEALAQFDLRRNMTKTGIFKAIEPFEVN
ncbi:DUF4236 domain-containing protein [Geomonas subterranea]|uniref:DUF4236 domain-containing protein n=1 Tax=Geomonas subterranea TaxID=2847989 RepID=UPI001CD4625D|nr:DUF4236 domain-containing protein [Geomonas fuzhouensis]